MPKCQLTFAVNRDIINIYFVAILTEGGKMVKHIVMWKFKESAEGRSAAENMELVKDRLYALVGVIDEIKKMEVGIDISHKNGSMDLALITEFESAEALGVYAVHPEHLKVVDLVRKVTETRVVLDYNM